MTPGFLILLAVVLALAFAAAWQRRGELRRQRAAVAERASMAVRSGDGAPVQLPVVDLDQCLGCGTCVRECPEEGVLALVHGQAAVVNPAGCVGHARCVSECPTNAVSLQAGDLSQRQDVPVLTEELQAAGCDGLFLIGEITGRSLIRSATEQGARLAATLAADGDHHDDEHTLDVLIVGAGPAGIACALALREQGVDFLLLDQEEVIGGAVAKYPRKKLVLTDDVVLPGHGRLERREFQKEELIALWSRLADQHELPFRGGVSFERVERDGDAFVVHTDGEPLRARRVVLAVGRRGRPRRLGVRGEELPHVTYSLLDAASYQDSRCVVVGGGDTAVEAALALAEQPGNDVTIVYRQDEFFRLRSKNRQRLQQQVTAQNVQLQLSCDVLAIDGGGVEIAPVAGADGGGVATTIAADHVFVLIGGDPPFEQLRKSGVSFDHEPVAAAPAGEGGDGGRSDLVWALGAGLALVVAVLGFMLWHADYYLQSEMARAALPKHATLRPGQNLGLWFGLSSTAAVLLNLAYLLRRQQWWGVTLGRLSTWMNVHVATGVIALALAVLHAGAATKASPGGYALWALVVLLVTGAIGRWFYAWLPRSANGREQRLDELRVELQQLRRQRGANAFVVAARAETMALIERRQWAASWFGRVSALLGLRRDLRRTLSRVEQLASEHAASTSELAAERLVTRRAHQLAVAVAHLEDLRALLGSWRWLHRWLALLMVLLLLAHVALVTIHGALRIGGGG